MKIAGHDFPIVQGASNPDDVSESGLGSRISNALARLPGAVRDMQNQLNQSQAELVAAQRKLGLPFPKANELAEKVAERAQLQAEMAAETKAAEEAAKKAAEAAKKAAEAAKAAPDTVKESRAPYGVSPVSLKDFRNNWVAHIDLRGDNREAIEREGFRKGYVNALMPWTGGSKDSVDAMAWNYRPRAGQTVYLVPPGGAGTRRPMARSSTKAGSRATARSSPSSMTGNRSTTYTARRSMESRNSAQPMLPPSQILRPRPTSLRASNRPG